MVTYYRGEGEVKSLAAKAGKVQANAQQAAQQLELNFKKEQMMLDYQFRLEAEKRARAWDLEKMEIASRLDFEESEKRRIQQKNEFLLGVDEINKRRFSRGGNLDDAQADRALLNWAREHESTGEAAQYLGIQEGLSPYQQQMLELRKQEIEARKDPLAEIYNKILSGESLSVGEKNLAESRGVQTEAQPVPQAVTQNQPKVSDRPVLLSSVSPKDVPQENGKFIVINPQTGNKELVTPDEYPKLLDEGYYVQPIVSGMDKHLSWFTPPILAVGEVLAARGKLKAAKQGTYSPEQRVQKGLQNTPFGTR